MMSNPPNTVIFQYVRNRRREKVGVVVATKRSDNKVGFGYSLCATNRGDKFNPELALNIALGRAENFPYFDGFVPDSVENDWSEIYHRAERYFKDAKIAGTE
jgi:hypothetical protein